MELRSIKIGKGQKVIQNKKPAQTAPAFLLL